MKDSLILLLLTLLFCSCSEKQQSVPCGELDLHSMICPAPSSAKFVNDSSYIGYGTMVKSPTDAKYHLFYSRWPRRLGMSAGVTHSEIAHTVSDSPFGPFFFKEVTLPQRGREYRDGRVTHNPTILFNENRY